MCRKDSELWSYPHECAQIKQVINNPHVNNQFTNKVIHISTDLSPKYSNQCLNFCVKTRYKNGIIEIKMWVTE